MLHHLLIEVHSLRLRTFIVQYRRLFMLEALITSKTRIKLLMKFFLNKSSESYLRNLETEFGGSSNGIRLELNKFETAGLLNSSQKGNKKYFRANTDHPLFGDIHNLLLKHIGIDKIIDEVVSNIGSLYQVFLVGDFAKGLDGGIIDIIFVGDDINQNYLLKIVGKAEKLIKRKIRYMLFSKDEIQDFINTKEDTEYMLLWSNNNKS